MCGIVGFITDEETKYAHDRHIFMRDGLIMDTLRGADATGVFAVPHRWSKDVKPHEKQAHYLKRAVPGHTFVTSEEYSKMVHPVKDWRAIIGHNRAATRGKRDDDNAHPFQEGDVTLVHNGTLETTYGLPHGDMFDLNKGLPKKNEITVDSHVLCHNLAISSPNDAGDVISKVRGAFALVWNDARDESINIIRNSDRPLHMAFSKDDNTLFFMSESEMLYALSKRSNIRLDTIFYPKPGVWMKWLPDTPTRTPITQTLTLAPKWSARSAQGAYDYYSANEGSKWATRFSRPALPPPPPPSVVVPPGKPQATAGVPLCNKVTLLGRRREIPQVHQENLYLYGLLVEDRLPFLPHMPAIDLPEDPLTGSPVAAEGCLYGGDAGRYSAVVYGVPNCMYKTALERKITERLMWTVRPLGIKWVTNARHIDEPVVLCKLVTATFTDSKQPPKEEESRETVLGPRNETWSADEYLKHVEGGCSLCKAPLGLLDADTISWEKDGPVCSECVYADGDEDMLRSYYNVGGDL
jgi:hypothetical protein